MSKELKKLVQWFALIVVMATALSYGVYSGAKANSLEQTVIENEQEIKALNADLKSHKALMYEKDIEIHEKDSTIQHQAATNEGLVWQLKTRGSQDE